MTVLMSFLTSMSISVHVQFLLWYSRVGMVNRPFCMSFRLTFSLWVDRGCGLVLGESVYKYLIIHTECTLRYLHVNECLYVTGSLLYEWMCVCVCVCVCVCGKVSGCVSGWVSGRVSGWVSEWMCARLINHTYLHFLYSIFWGGFTVSEWSTRYLV